MYCFGIMDNRDTRQILISSIINDYRRKLIVDCNTFYCLAIILRPRQPHTCSSFTYLDPVPSSTWTERPGRAGGHWTLIAKSTPDERHSVTPSPFSFSLRFHVLFILGREETNNICQISKNLYVCCSRVFFWHCISTLSSIIPF